MDTHSCRTQLENKVISPWHFCNYMSLGRELPGWQEGPLWAVPQLSMPGKGSTLHSDFCGKLGLILPDID